MKQLKEKDFGSHYKPATQEDFKVGGKYFTKKISGEEATAEPVILTGHLAKDAVLFHDLLVRGQVFVEGSDKSAKGKKDSPKTKNISEKPKTKKTVK